MNASIRYKCSNLHGISKCSNLHGISKRGNLHVGFNCSKLHHISMRTAVLVPTAMLLASVAGAAELATPVQIHGFASQAYTLTSANNIFGTSSDDNGSFGFTELGVNASYRATSQLHLAAQLMSRRAGETDDSQVRLDYGVADYRISTDDKTDWGVRAGRIKNPIGFYNDTRDVAFTRPSIILPQSIYFDRVRDIQISSDGVQFYGQGQAPGGDFNLQLQVGDPRVGDSATEVALLGADRAGSLQGNPSYLGRLSYDWNSGRVRLAYSEYRLDLDYAAADQDPNGAGSVIFQPRIFSAQYNAERWSVTSEYARRHFEFNSLGRYVPYSTLTGQSYYVQASYMLRPQWELLAHYDVLYQNKDDKTGEQYEAITRGTRPAYSQFAKDRSLTLSWTPASAWLIRAEQHWVDGTAWLPIQDNPDPAATTRNWRLFALLVSFRF